MQECCAKNSKLKWTGYVSLLDAIGLLILLPFYGLAIWAVSSIVSFVVMGILRVFWAFGQYEAIMGLTALYMVGAWMVIKSLPKVLLACSYLLNFKIHIYKVCENCGTHKDLLKAPKDITPFKTN